MSRICSYYCWCCRVTQSCPTFCEPMYCSKAHLLVLHFSWSYSNSSGPQSSQHQGLFQWVGSSHQVAKILKLQLQNQSFQWIFRIDYLLDWLVWSLCRPRDSQRVEMTLTHPPRSGELTLKVNRMTDDSCPCQITLSSIASTLELPSGLACDQQRKIGCVILIVTVHFWSKFVLLPTLIIHLIYPIDT